MLSRSPAEKSIYFASTTKIRQVCNSSFQYILQLFKSLFPLLNVYYSVYQQRQTNCQQTRMQIRGNRPSLFGGKYY